RIAQSAAKAGAAYYVIDCGWHNEEDGHKVYPYVGQWKESKARFPHGVRATTDYIRSLGMKAGLWIEPEIIGVQCEEMLSYYDEECFLHRGGKRIAVMGRYFLNFSAKKVIGYLTETIRRMVEDYGAQYIKMDYNEDIGVTDESLTADRAAYLQWIDGMRDRFPDVLIETCSSGGMRMDYETLKHFSLVSTSDQTDYKLYPFISANILSAVLPEQAAVWNYPVVGEGEIGSPFTHDEKWVHENVSQEQIVMNTVNALLGRMHLASHIEMLSPAQFALAQEGIVYYNKLTPVKKMALPYFPLGFTLFGVPYAACGLKADKKLYLAVWNLGGKREVCIPIPEGILAVTVGYPCSLESDFAFNENALTVRFDEKYAARVFEIEIADTEQ
ncbi:MAG: alpha-galactosidase, partial [Clostridia bacterium]|nr:alpha-galactosidase [Clostridia bacterium]